MCIAQSESTGPSLFLIEGVLTLLSAACAFAFPAIGRPVYCAIESFFSRIARKKLQAVLLVGALLVVLRVAILPWQPVPLPFAPNDFSFLLAADTFVHGRLANPTPAMWVHFESIHIDMVPAYVSMYFPGQALVLAAGKLILGGQWNGILLASGAMCASICWMLQAWFPSRWALAGGLISVFHLALFSYWTNTFSGGASVAAVGGALVLGGCARWRRAPTIRCGLWMALGAGLLVLTRPYEGALLCVGASILLVQGARASAAPVSTLLLRLLPAAMLLAAMVAWLGYYNYRAFGNPLTLPYTVNRATYAVAPYYVWQSPRPVPHYRHADLAQFYLTHELDQYKAIHSWGGFLPQSLIKVINAILFFSGVALLPILFALPRALRDRRMRGITLCLAILVAGMSIEIYLLPHYIAPFTAALYALALQCMRHVFSWRPGGRRVGAALVRLCLTSCVLIAGLRIFNRPLHMPVHLYPQSNWINSWYGPDHWGTDRQRVAEELDALPGTQLVLVRYAARHEPSDEWVYNAADIDHSKVIWARDMGPEDNAELVHYYQSRRAWLLEPDANPIALTPYR